MAEICELLEAARQLVTLVDHDGPRGLDALRGYTVLNMFGEPSTRTRSSFEIAGRRLGANVVTFVVDEKSSTTKGESFRDTVRNLDAMGLDALVVRHVQDGLPEKITQWVRARVVNAGDGRLEHPTQALLDTLTILEAFNRPLAADRTLDGLRVAICGDVDNGRVAHSDILAFRALGAYVVTAGPEQLLSDEIARRYEVPCVRNLDDAIDGADVVVMLRIQRERLSGELSMSDAEYHAAWGLTETRLERTAPTSIVLHPGPINRGIELPDSVADGPRSRILRQVSLGVAVRMAVLCRACGVTPEEIPP